MGFNQSEMIKLVACGHTMGAVRSPDFPQLVTPNPNTTAPVLANFDETMAFDNLVLVIFFSNTPFLTLTLVISELRITSTAVV